MIPRAVRVCLCWRSSFMLKKCRREVLNARLISTTRCTKQSEHSTYSVLCSAPVVSSSEIPNVIHHKLTAYWALHEFICQRRYDEAMDLWDVLKSSGQVDPALYGVLMAMCEKMGSADRARDVRSQMEGVGLVMDEKCSLHYLNALLSGDKVDEAMEFMTENCPSELTHDPAFLLKATNSFISHHHLEHALSLSHQATSPELHSLQLGLLGHLGRTDDMKHLIDKHYGGSVSSATLSVQLSMVRGLALADEYKEAFETVKRLKRRCSDATVDPETLALLLESTIRANDVQTGVDMYHMLWRDVNSVTTSTTSEPTTLKRSPTTSDIAAHIAENSEHLLRALNSAITLQSLIFKRVSKTRRLGGDLKNRKVFPRKFGWAENMTRSSWQQEVSGVFDGEIDIQNFMAQNFYQQLLSWSLVPDQQTYEALLLLTCYVDVASTMADQALKRYIDSGGKLSPEAFTAWTKQCGPLLPRQAYKVMGLVFLHSDGYSVPLRLEEYQRLLGVVLKCGRSRKLEKEAADCIRSIKHVMQKHGYLNTAEEWNLILTALSVTGNIGALVTTYNDMQECEHIKPNLDTFHALIDGNLRSQSHRNSKAAAYIIWRDLVKLVPRVKPDVLLMNKLIRSCRICKNYDRGFFFFSQLKEFELAPNLDTFRELLKICREENNREKFHTVVQLAKKCLPGEIPNIITVVSGFEQEWKTEEDIDLAKAIIGRVHTKDE